MIFGDKKPFITGIVVPNQEILIDYAKTNQIAFSSYSELVKSEIIKTFLFNEVERSTRQLASFEKLKAIIVTENDFSLDLGEVTPTLKVRRKIIEQKFIKELKAIYVVNR